MTFLWLATPSQILIFSNLILHNFKLISKYVSSYFKVFIFLQMWCAKSKMCEWICVKASPRTYISQRTFLVGLYFVSHIFERLNFRMWRLRKELGQWASHITVLKSCVYCVKLRDTYLSYLSKDISCFDEEVVCILFRGNPF